MENRPRLAKKKVLLHEYIKVLEGNRFDSGNKIISQTNAHCEDLDKSDCLEVVKKFKRHRTKCMERKRDHVAN